MTNDVDFFAGNMQDKSYFRQKQERFEHKTVLKLLRGLEVAPGIARRVGMRAGEHFGVVWIMQNYPNFPLRLTTFKAPTTVQLIDLVKWPERTRAYKELDKTRDDFAGDPVGIIFTSDGDGMQEMVMHEHVEWRKADGYWRVQLVGDKFILDPLDGFIESFKLNSDWRLTEE